MGQTGGPICGLSRRSHLGDFRQLPRAGIFVISLMGRHEADSGFEANEWLSLVGHDTRVGPE